MTDRGTRPAESAARPLLSIVVVAYRMPRQALNTLHTLSAAYQREIEESDYEVIVVENESDLNLDGERVRSLGSNFRYHLRSESGVSPAGAINAGLKRCRGTFVGLMIDGARMATPRIVRYALDGLTMDQNALVVIPGYRLGREEQLREGGIDFDERREQALLESIDWRSDGYQLFEIGSLGDANPRGFFHPLLESNAMFASRERFAAIGDADERFQLPGGGGLNLHLYRSLGTLPDTRLVVLAGEGTFHQQHGGVSTSANPQRGPVLDAAADQLHEIWDGGYRTLEKEPVILGAVTGPGLLVMERAAQFGIRRFARRAGRADQPEWRDDPMRPGGL